MSCTQFMVLREEREREREKKIEEREKLSKKLVNISVIQERDNANQFINNLFLKDLQSKNVSISEYKNQYWGL